MCCRWQNSNRRYGTELDMRTGSKLHTIDIANESARGRKL